MSAGMNSSRNTPLLGLAFLISAITADWPAVILARSAPSKSRVSTRLSASKRTTSSGFFLRAAAISSCLTATILLRMSLMGLIFLGWGRLQHLLDDPVHHHTGHDEQQRDANGDPGAFVLQPDGHMPLLQGPVPAVAVWVKACSSASLAAAAPDSMVRRARAMPCPMSSQTLAAYSAAPALSATMSRAALSAGSSRLSNTPSSMALESSGVSTRNARLLAMVRPKSSGWISYSVISPFFSSPTMVAAPSEISSIPSRP